MKSLLSPLFVFSFTIFIVHQVAQKFFNLHFHLIDRYLDSVLAMPVILHLLKVERVLIFKKGDGYQLSVLEISMATVYVILMSEILFPILSDKFTSDLTDVFFYFAGSLVYYLFNKPKR
jgi:hypothetical protein